jgi:hypothetical protein
VQTFVVADAAINDLRQSKARIAEDRLAVHALEYALKLTARTNGSERLKVEIMP